MSQAAVQGTSQMGQDALREWKTRDVRKSALNDPPLWDQALVQAMASARIATPRWRRHSFILSYPRAEQEVRPWRARLGSEWLQSRKLQTVVEPEQKVPNFAFAFDIDGVLLRSADPIPRAAQALSFLQSQKIPFILLTNGGGKHESERVRDITQRLRVPLDTSMFIQSHTPISDHDEYKEKTVLVVGGEGDKCRHVAESYGFKNVVIPADILVQYPHIWPFSNPWLDYYKPLAKPLPRPIDPEDPAASLQIDAIFVYNDPRDWDLDAAIIIDLLLSESGIMGTISRKNDDPSLPNHGYQQDNQPPIYFCNPDLWWATKYHLPRLGQGAFREAIEGIWAAITGGAKKGVELQKHIIGKPYHETYEFAEKRLVAHRNNLFPEARNAPLGSVYMVGDNPESDIKGGNGYRSPLGTDWRTILVKTGIYQNGEPSEKPTHITKDVFEAVQTAVKEQGWRKKL